MNYHEDHEKRALEAMGKEMGLNEPEGGKLVLKVTRRGSHFRAHRTSGALFVNAHGRLELNRIIASKMWAGGWAFADIDGKTVSISTLKENK